MGYDRAAARGDVTIKLPSLMGRGWGRGLPAIGRSTPAPDLPLKGEEIQFSSYATVVTTRTFWNGVFAPLESQYSQSTPSRALIEK
ncbi:hypothetical protein TMRO357_00501 [Alteriqipengyuania sp. 357]